MPMASLKCKDPAVLTVAVLSDLHAYEPKTGDGTPKPSHYSIADVGADAGKSPIAGLKALISREHLVADVLLCPGDLAHQANPVAIDHAWRAVHAIKKSLKGRLMAATAGNHDVDSRYTYNDFDAKGVLQSLDPPFPLPNAAWNDRFWSRHYVIIRTSILRLLVLNSSAFHGEGRYLETSRYEFENGRVSPRTLAAIERELIAHKAHPPVNVVLCHHHPHPHSELGLGEDDLMAGGQRLLDLLGSGRFGRWFILHGHKHHPKIENAAGAADAPIVLAAGSLSATLSLELQTAARNQFYILSFPHSSYSAHGFGGRFRSWDWLAGTGWVQAGISSGLPAAGGFGWKGDLSVLAGRIAAMVQGDLTDWNAIRLGAPEVDFMLPQDLLGLESRLMASHSIRMLWDGGLPRQIGRVIT